MVDEATMYAARDLYNQGKLQEAGQLIGILPVAKIYGHSFDETPESYAKRLRVSLEIPEPMDFVPGTPAETRAVEPEEEDVPEPEDDDDDSPRRGRLRRRT